MSWVKLSLKKKTYGTYYKILEMLKTIKGTLFQNFDFLPHLSFVPAEKIDMNSQILKVFLALPSYFWKMIEEIWTEILLKKINENKCFVSFKSHWLFFIF